MTGYNRKQLDQAVVDLYTEILNCIDNDEDPEQSQKIQGILINTHLKEVLVNSLEYDLKNRFRTEKKDYHITGELSFSYIFNFYLVNSIIKRRNQDNFDVNKFTLSSIWQFFKFSNISVVRSIQVGKSNTDFYARAQLDDEENPQKTILLPYDENDPEHPNQIYDENSSVEQNIIKSEINKDFSDCYEKIVGSLSPQDKKLLIDGPQVSYTNNLTMYNQQARKKSRLMTKVKDQIKKCMEKHLS